MGLFGSSGDTGGTGGGDFGSKLRTPSYSEDLTSDPAASSFGGGGSCEGPHGPRAGGALPGVSDWGDGPGGGRN